MKSIVFVDTEIEPKSQKIIDIGGISDKGIPFHSNSVSGFVEFLRGSDYLCGHNIINFDLKYIRAMVHDAGIDGAGIIDTLHLSPLLFPARPYHALVKDDKLQTEDINNPLNDAIKARDLFNDEVDTFKRLEEPIKQIFFLLLHGRKEFQAFFKSVPWSCIEFDIEQIIRSKFMGEICENAGISKIVFEHPVELAYCLALINCRNRYSILPPWVQKNYPAVDRIMNILRNRPCLTGCSYCNNAMDSHLGLKKYFGYDFFRNYAGEPLQEKAVKAALDNKSFLAVFPTGGGKSITFQLPALMSGEATRGLTVVISPLQSLMKDQVDNLEKAGITDAVTINGLLDPIDRGKSFERVEDGSASLLYISPESLRSRTIERLLLGRKIVRFVIDEAHCFSSWGQDFRVDYLYIGDFIRSIQEKKVLEEPIPVSCFTATAKLKVIEDIRSYFREKLSIELALFSSGASRTNLHYKVIDTNDDGKYNILRNLIEEKECPAIVYVSRTRTAFMLARKLCVDGFGARHFHGKMESQEKTANQDAFISGEVNIMVATSAFGMGVDKKDVGMVIHYEISDSLENYIQEAGRAGRDEEITAECYVLFNEEDLGKHFILLNQTKLSIKEIQQVWKAIKEITRFRASVSNSALEIARKAGWDDSVVEIETRVNTAIATLEQAGYLKRGQNMPRVFADSILSRNAQDAIDKINASPRFVDKDKEKAIRIIKKLISSKSRKQPTDEAAESRIDYISDLLGISKAEVIKIVNLLREEKILADNKDLTAFIKKGENVNRSLQIVKSFCCLENFLLKEFLEQETTYNLKELNEKAFAEGIAGVSLNRLKTIINFWAIKKWIKSHYEPSSASYIVVQPLHPPAELKERFVKRDELARFLVEFLFEKSNSPDIAGEPEKEDVLVGFSVHELKSAFENQMQLFEMKISIADIEDALFYLSRIEAIKMEGGFLVVYNGLTIERLEQDSRKRFRAEDYEKLNLFYENKIQQIHIVGEYAKKMIDDYKGALQFVDDYFKLNYTSFLNRYFPGSRQNEIKSNITPAKFKELFGTLSPGQLEIIKDNQTQYIVVAAGPGSGKTKLLVHKLASLLLMEDVKHEQLLMVTFSRAAATEFKKRLLTLIGNAANYIEIKTFHSYCFDILGQVGSLEKSESIVKSTVEKIRNGDVERTRITKTVLVIDEAQDMNKDEFELIEVLIGQNEEMRVIAVGDDDQNIYEFRGSSSVYLERFITEKRATKHELTVNFRSKSNLVEFTNSFVKKIRNRMKETPIVASQTESGKIRILHYHTGNLIIPLVNDIMATGLSGTTCILTKTNEEAWQVAGLLLNRGMPAKLIQSNDGFNLINLEEIRFYLRELKLGTDSVNIDEDDWQRAKKTFGDKFRTSSRFEICRNIIQDFELISPKKKYRSDLEAFLKESRLEDFIRGSGETILVSTIHKAKGKEFDNVIMMLDNIMPETDEAIRQLYVAMTRARQNLTIHLNGGYLDSITTDNLDRTEDLSAYPPPARLTLQATHDHVNLGYFEFIQPRMQTLMSGQLLTPAEEGWANSKGDRVLKFSKKFTELISENKKNGYDLQEVKVNFIVYWKKPDDDKEIKIILPEVSFVKTGSEH